MKSGNDLEISRKESKSTKYTLLCVNFSPLSTYFISVQLFHSWWALLGARQLGV